MLCFAIALLLTTTLAYDYYTFAAEWAGSVCATDTCSDATGISKTYLNLHGLWPSVYSGTQPSNCPGPAWDPSAISAATAKAMIADWSGLFSSADDFHNHEWTKHGTCWNDPSGGNKINDFFTEVITLGNKFDLYNALLSQGIVPSTTKTYTQPQFIAAMNATFGITVMSVICQTSSKSESTEFLDIEATVSYFNGYYICLDLNYKPINCPSSYVDWIELGSTCSKTAALHYPPITV